jgi:hypothetical protein
MEAASFKRRYSRQRGPFTRPRHPSGCYKTRRSRLKRGKNLLFVDEIGGSSFLNGGFRAGDRGNHDLLRGSVFFEGQAQPNFILYKAAELAAIPSNLWKPLSKKVTPLVTRKSTHLKGLKRSG